MHEIRRDCVMIRRTHETKRTNFRCEGRRRADLTTGRSEVDDFDFVGVLRMRQLKCASQRTKLAHTIFGAIGIVLK